MEPCTKILVVDDMRCNLQVVEAILSSLDVEVHLAESGERALELVDEHSFAVIILDVNMPGLDGFETAQLIRNRPRNENTPILFLTATEAKSLAEGYELGAVDYMISPVDPPILLSKVAAFGKIDAQRACLEYSLDLLSQSLVQLEDRNRSLKEFAHVVAHDLRAPLRGVTGLSGLLQKEYDTLSREKTFEYLDMIQNSGKRMDRLVESLLRFAVASMPSDATEQVDLNQVLVDVTEDLAETIRTSGAEIEFGGLPTLQANRVQMYQVFLNLLSNSLKFRKPDLPCRVVVSGRPPDRDGICLIRVEDNGIGFDVEDAGIIFEPLKRLHASASIEGSGLGLATTKKIVDQHNGEIGVESHPGEGTVFTISLPTHQRLDLQQAESQIRDIVDKDAM